MNVRNEFDQDESDEEIWKKSEENSAVYLLCRSLTDDQDE